MNNNWFKTKAESIKLNHIHLAKDINTNGCKQYTSVDSYEKALYIIKYNKCVYEVVTGKWTEMYDFDGNINSIISTIDLETQTTLLKYDNIKPIINDVVNNFKYVYNKHYPNRKVCVKTCSGHKISIHFIIPKSVFNDYISMKQQYQWLMSDPELKYKEYYDGSIYTRDRLIRTNYSDKAFSNRIFRSDDNDMDLFVSHPLTKELNHRGILELSLPSLVDPNGLTINKRISFKDIGINNQTLLKYNLYNAFIVDKEMSKNMYRLKRIKSSYCLICKRVHDNENAYININDMSYGCFRDLSRKTYIDSDIVKINIIELRKLLKQYNLNDDDIDYVISRSKYII